MIREVVSGSVAVAALAGVGAGAYEAPEIMASRPYAEVMGHDPLSINPDTIELPDPVRNLEGALAAEDLKFMGKIIIGSGAIIEVDGRRGVIGATHVGSFAGGKCEDQQATLNTTRRPIHAAISKIVQSEIPTSEEDDSLEAANDVSISLLKNSRVLENLPAVTAQNDPVVHRGEVLFNIARGSSKDPNDKPKVTLAVVTRVKGKEIDMLTDLRGYGEDGTAGSQTGDSGGVLVDQSGNYVGNLVASDQYAHSNKDIQQQDAIWLPHKPEGYRPSYAQLVTESDARQMMTQAMHAKPCTEHGYLS